MERKIVGKVNESEQKEIEVLFEKKNALEAIMKALNPSENETMYERVVSDYSNVNTNFENWWSIMHKKYSWESSSDGHWQIDFSNGDIILCYNTN